MANDVFANGREISCKAADGKSIAAFPDVCFTPPQTPATPPGVPIPYPNTAFAKDATSGSKKVKISGKEVMLKNKSYFKTSTGDEAGCAPKKGVATSKIKGKAYFTSWSMDVKFEGENVVRHFDLTTHNHASQPSNTPPWPYADAAAPSTGPCAGQPPKCKMQPYKPDRCKPKTGHHAIPVHCFMAPGARSLPKVEQAAFKYAGCSKYNPNKAVVICVSGEGKEKTHGRIHSIFDPLEDSPRNKGVWSYKQAENAAVKSVCSVIPDCSPKCIRAQIRYNHKQELGLEDQTKLRANSAGSGKMNKRPSLTRSARGRR
jgi:hypothetical protein